MRPLPMHDLPAPRRESRLRAWPFVHAVAAGVAVVVSAPAMGEIRRWLRLTFPGHFVALVGVAVAVAAFAAIAMALARIREHRLPRYALIAAALVLAVVYSAWSALGNPESDVVEHVHFVEYGLVAWLFCRAWRPLGDASVLVLALLCAITVGTCEEWFQWFIPARVGEVRDVLLNTASIVSGLLISAAAAPLPSWSLRWQRRSWRHVLMTLAMATAMLAGFVDSAHVGVEHRDAEGRVFRSIYSLTDLRGLAEARASAWAISPPLQRPARVSREDQYMSEGLWHVQARNTAWAAGDVGTAWAENRILEEFFGPVLDAPSYVSATGHRWAPEQRADADRRRGNGGASGFVSRAQGAFPIWTWSRTRFRFFAALLVLVLMASAIRLGRRA